MDTLNSSKNKTSFHKLYDAEYDLSNMQIISVDGALPYVDEQEARLLFFHNIPNIENNKPENGKLLNRGLVEVRMSNFTLKRILGTIIAEIQYFENSNKNNPQLKLQIKDHDQVMFG